MSTKDSEDYLEPEYRPNEEWMDPIPRFEKRGERSKEVMAGKGNVKYQRPGHLVRVVCGDGDLIPDEPQPSTDVEYIGRVGVNIGDGGMGETGEFRQQFVKFSDGEEKAFCGWQLEWVYQDLDLERIRCDYEISHERFAEMLREWLDAQKVGEK